MRHAAVIVLAVLLLGWAAAQQPSNSSQDEPVREYNDDQAAPPPQSQPQQEPRDYNDDTAQPPQSAPQSKSQPEEPVKEYNDDQPPAGTPVQQVAPGTKPATTTATPPPASSSQPAAPAQQKAAPLSPREQEMRAIAEQFAPVIYQRVVEGDDARFDWPTNFDFDGDWVGNNNWEHAADKKYKMWSFVYYDVIESEDHYFIHYSLFHARDWSTVQGSYDDVLDKLQQKYKDIFGDGLRKEAEFNHENDLEGILVIVNKWGEFGPEVVALESVAHNHMLTAIAPGAATDDLVVTGKHKLQALRLEDGRPVIYVESQKHGIHPLTDERNEDGLPLVKLTYGKSVEVSQMRGDAAGYDLINQVKTFWTQARQTHEPNRTFGTVIDFSDRYCGVRGATRPACEIGVVGGAFRGDVARPNAANAPWAWNDVDDADMLPGSWVFDPIAILRRHFGYDSSEKYLYNPYLGIDIGGPPPQNTK